MVEIALASINSFASPAPTAGFLQALLEELQALREEVARLQEDIQDLRATVTSQELEISSLKASLISMEAQVSTLEKQQEADEERFAVDIAHDRQRITRLENPPETEPQPMQRDRGDILRALLATNDGKMLLKAARQKMHLSKSRFSELLATMREYIETKPFSRDHRQKVLVLK